MIAVETVVHAPIAHIWRTYTSPEDVMKWNFASDEWCCPAATADLSEGGAFSFRMEARDGSVGFDFEGIYTKIVENELIEYKIGDRHAKVEFSSLGERALVRVTFEADAQFPLEHQRDGWQAILDNFASHAEWKDDSGLSQVR